MSHSGSPIFQDLLSFSVLVATLGCGGHADPPAQVPAAGADRPGHEQACMSENRGRGSESTCTFDSECDICHDGSSCGVPMSLAEIQARGDACQKEDAAECEPTTPRCCDGMCVVSGWMYVDPEP